jgi:glycosyltransferase involved in cell wall biosynthesis
MNITGIVITKNEEKNIAGCIKSLEWCNQVIVVDSFSKDNTVQIARDMNAVVFQNKFIDYASQRKFAIEQSSSDWIIMIDADERVTLELKNEIIDVLENPTSEAITAYEVPMADFMFGKYIKYGGWCGYYRTSLFRKSFINIEGSVHEKIKTSGVEKKLNSPILHFSHFSIDHFMFKLNKYTAIEARSEYEKGKRSNILRITALPVVVFLYKYFYKKGFMDGIHGYALAVMMSVYHFNREIKIMMIDYQDKNYRETEIAIENYNVHPRLLE